MSVANIQASRSRGGVMYLFESCITSYSNFNCLNMQSKNSIRITSM